ncbi:hypothetical protein C9374_002225 [Naegleria lovaniensis]|uniref:Multidrug and toxin extrusion protein n=1 Tax=Naegleria lovaniensis TaxID=51637 RepID=A0AA88GV86_NAELO|nr:uncharacterized protein C9374_002225 [Naegleria lovaniensis]KAG2386481.1 hypothetical protein C9374_002225 [Naegleria lovaniensis]
MATRNEGIHNKQTAQLNDSNMEPHADDTRTNMSRMESSASFESAYDAKPMDDQQIQTSTLLHHQNHDSFSNSEDDIERGQEKEMEYDYNSLSRKEKFKLFLLNLKKEFRGMLEIAFPTVLMNVSNKILGLEDMAFIGHLNNENYLASSALANAVFFCFSFISVGLIGGQDTFVAQAFGAKNLRLMGVWWARSLLIILLGLIPILIMMIFLEQGLLLIQIQPEIASHAASFVRYLLPGLFPFALCRSTARFLVSMNIRLPNTLIPMMSIFVNFALNWLFVFGIGFEGFGFVGAAIATSLARFFMLLCYIYVIFHYRDRLKECFEGFVQFKQVLEWKGIWDFLKLSIPGTIATCAEVWAFEFTSILASYLSATHTAAHAICLNIVSLSFMFPLAISTAASVLVGQHLGAREPSRAKYAAYLCLVVSAVFMMLNGVVVGSLSTLIPRIYTSEEQVIDLAAKVFPLTLLFGVFDGVQGTASGVLRGVGAQTVGMISNLVAYYVISLPIGAVLAFVVNMQLVGLWLGLTLGLIIVAFSLVVYIIRINWERQSKIAHERSSTVVEISTNHDTHELLTSTMEIPMETIHELVDENEEVIEVVERKEEASVREVSTQQEKSHHANGTME